MLRASETSVSKHVWNRMAGQGTIACMNESGAYLYILSCADGSYYVGTARKALEARVAEHQAGHFGGHTAKRLPVRLVFSQNFQRIEDAIAAERQVKGWSRQKKGALIAGDLGLLPVLSRRRTRS